MPCHGAQHQKTLYGLASDQEGSGMPEIYVHAVEGRTLEQKRGLVRDITEAVVKHFNVSADRVMVQIVESPKENKAKGGVLFSDR
jgi:4-oxalocrotonate tautomerase